MGGLENQELGTHLRLHGSEVSLGLERGVGECDRILRPHLGSVGGTLVMVRTGFSVPVGVLLGKRIPRAVFQNWSGSLW